MAKEKKAEDENQNDNNDFDEDIADECTDDFSSDEDYYKKTDDGGLSIDEDDVPPATEFTMLRIGITSLVVSSDGRIRRLEDVFSSTLGFALPGTPYRTFPVEVCKGHIEDYYVHDLVWRAFNGEPPEGWEVRHSFWEAKNSNEFYSNCLENLQIYPTTVTRLVASVRKSLPTHEETNHYCLA